MRRTTWKWGALALAGLAVAGCGSAQADSTEAGTESEGYVRVINVEVAPVQPERFVEEIRLTGVAVSLRDRLVAAQENGEIVEMFVDWGDWVEEGDPIARLDDSLLRAEVAQARAQAELAAETWERRRRLWEEDRVGSELAYLEARFAAERSAAALEALETRLERTVVRAPFAGVIEELRSGVGGTMSQMSQSGTDIVRLVELDPIVVHAGVPERYAADVQVGDSAVLSFDALGGEQYPARVGYVGATVNAESRTFLIMLGVRNPNRRIKPQMVANVALTRRAVDDAIVLPQDALVRVEDGYVAFVAVERGGVEVAEARPIVLGPTRRNLVVAESGIDSGDRVIVIGQRSVEDGDRINIVGEGR
jgi:membrane fusion protein (multidrug efflux system)